MDFQIKQDNFDLVKSMNETALKQGLEMCAGTAENYAKLNDAPFLPYRSTVPGYYNTVPVNDNRNLETKFLYGICYSLHRVIVVSRVFSVRANIRNKFFNNLHSYSYIR